MGKIKHWLRKLKIFAKMHFTPKRILKQRFLKFILVSWLIILAIHGGFAIQRAIIIPATKSFPQISFVEFLKQVEEERIEYLHLKYVYDGVEVLDFEANKLRVLIKLRDGKTLTVSPIEFWRLSYIQFITRVKNGEANGIVILPSSYYSSGGRILGWSEDGAVFINNLSSFLSDREELSKILTERDIPYWEVKTRSIGESNFKGKWILTIWLFPHILGLLAFIFILNRSIRNKEVKALRAGAFSKEKITFSDVAGVDEAKEDVMEILDFIKCPEKFIKHGAKLPRGILLVGPPGCGKTLLAKALAGEANVPFEAAVGSEFVEKYVGVGAQRIREKFQKVRAMARQDTAVILFIDEIDALGTRTESPESGEIEHAQTIAQILYEMDGFELNEKVFVIGATNRPENLDPAVRRPGRFDRQVIVQLPDLKGREAILRVHCRNKRIDDSVDFQKVAIMTPLGFSGADLANVANEAAIRAAKQDKEKIEMVDFEKAVEKVIVGPERKSAVMSDEDKWRTAYHEAGHAILAKFTPKANPPEKISIRPTTKGVGGFTRTAQKEEKYYWTKIEFLARIKVLFGGRIVEEMIFGEDGISTGAKEDFREATQIAEEMVCDFGMAADILGPRTFGTVEGSQYLGKTFRRQDYSRETAKDVDRVIRTILTQCYREAKADLKNRQAQIQLLAQRLKKKETLDIEEINQLLKAPLEKTGP